MSGRVCVVGSINVDLVVRTPRLPAPGETILGGPFDRFPGGKGANQAVAAARCGAMVELVGALGEDEHGRAMRGLLEGEGIGTAGVRTVQGVSTGVALITVEDGGENTIVVAVGANASVDAESVKSCTPAIQVADAVLMQLEVPVEGAAAAAHVAREFSTRIVLNAAPAVAVPPEVMELADVLIVNRIEAAHLCAGDAADAPESLAQRLVHCGVGTVVLTLGAQGAIILDEETLHVIPAFRVNSIDSVGAGDAFCGAFVTALAEGMEIHDAGRFASAAGALATVTSGAIPSLPARGDIEWLLDAQQTDG